MRDVFQRFIVATGIAPAVIVCPIAAQAEARSCSNKERMGQVWDLAMAQANNNVTQETQCVLTKRFAELPEGKPMELKGLAECRDASTGACRRPASNTFIHMTYEMAAITTP